jgi:nitroreductase
MDLTDALRTTGSVRTFRDAPVSLQTVYEILDDARFAPSGGNRQAWRVIVCTNPKQRQSLRDLYLDGWHDYIAHSLAGLIPFSPLATEDDRVRASAQRAAAEARSRPDGFAETIDQVPVLLLVCADLSVLAAVDRDLDRYQIAGGASIYPFVWSILLAAHDRGLGGVMTTMATRNEDAVRDVFSIPKTFALASVVALGHSSARFSKLRRRSVEEFATVDNFDGQPLTRS